MVDYTENLCSYFLFNMATRIKQTPMVTQLQGRKDCLLSAALSMASCKADVSKCFQHQNEHDLSYYAANRSFFTLVNEIKCWPRDPGMLSSNKIMEDIGLEVQLLGLQCIVVVSS